MGIEMKDNSIFLAVCKDQPDTSDGFYYTVYLVNNSVATLSNLSYSTYGYCTMDDELVTTSTHKQSLGTLEPRSAIKIEEDDDESFDFIIIFTFDYTSNGCTEQRTFQIGKRLSGGVKPFEILPVLGKFGYRFVANKQ